MTPLYLETSALLRALFREAGCREVLKCISAAPRLLASRLVQVECERALIRLRLDRPELEPAIAGFSNELKFLWPKVDFFELSPEICQSAGQVAPQMRIRTLDALHLATFYFAKKLDRSVRLLTFDERLLQIIPESDRVT